MGGTITYVKNGQQVTIKVPDTSAKKNEAKSNVSIFTNQSTSVGTTEKSKDSVSEYNVYKEDKPSLWDKFCRLFSSDDEPSKSKGAEAKPGICSKTLNNGRMGIGGRTLSSGEMSELLGESN